MIVRKEPFDGAHRYVRYRRRKRRPEYIYTNQQFNQKSSITPFLGLFYAPFIVLALWIILTGFRIPHHMTPPQSTQIVIEDHLGILDDTTQMQTQLTEFYEKTGIVPAITTVKNDQWKPYYSSLTDYAYDVYVNQWTDEKHWLLIYSDDRDTSNGFLDWYWEGMQGDDTDRILTKKKLDKFNKDLQYYLTANSQYSVTDAFTKAFMDLNKKIMKPSIYPENIFGGIGIIAFCSLQGLLILCCDSNFRYRHAVECAMDTKEVRCDYCGGVYASGTTKSCPYCGAPLSASTKYIQRQ